MRKNIMLLLIILIASVIMVAGCGSTDEQKNNKNIAESENSCIVCHSQKDVLSQITDEEKADGIVVKAEFMDTVHGKQSCDSCHQGNPKGISIELAHVGLQADPLADGGKAACGTCHKEIVDNFQTSLHLTVNGLKNGLVERIGDITPVDFSGFPEPFNKMGTLDGHALSDMIFEECYSCHASCGDCHINNPAPHGEGGGLKDGHLFTANKTLAENETSCSPCHHMTGPMYTNYDITGHVKDNEFPHKADVHYEKGMSCLSCHSSQEMHGDGKPVAQNMKVAEYVDTQCTDCHNDLAGKGSHSQTHLDSNSCYACHADTYYNCNDCHGSEEGALNWQFQLGFGKDGKITTYTHNPISENMFFGAPIFKLDEVNTKPFWIQSVPHTIRSVSANSKEDNYICGTCHSGNYDAFIKKEDFKEKGVEFPGADKIVVPESKLPKNFGL